MNIKEVCLEIENEWFANIPDSLSLLEKLIILDLSNNELESLADSF